MTNHEVMLRDNGYFVLQFQFVDALQEAQKCLLTQLRKMTKSSSITLETYHELNYTDEQHLDFQYNISEYFKDHELAIHIIKENLNFFKALLGPDLDIQARPYLRIARPGKKVDNIGFHRDTFYGGYPEELSIVIPFVDLPPEASLSMSPGSHVLPESDFLCEQTTIESKESFKKSLKHSLGFLYAPKTITNTNSFELNPIPIKSGEALVFMLSTLHGSVINSSSITRWSVDVRIKNSLNNLDLTSRPDYYKNISKSVLTKNCQLYYLNNDKVQTKS